MTVALLSVVGRRDDGRDTGTLRVVPVVSTGSGSGSAMRALPGSLCGPSPGVCPLKNAHFLVPRPLLAAKCSVNLVIKLSGVQDLF